MSSEAQQNILKLFQNDPTTTTNLITTDISTQQQQQHNFLASQALLGYLYQVNNTQVNENKNDLSQNSASDSSQIKNQSLHSLLNNSTLVLQCNLAQFSNLVPNQGDSTIQNLRIYPAVSAPNNSNNNNTCSNNNSNNTTKLRYLLNSDILTPINTANLLNSTENYKNGNNKRVLESTTDENKQFEKESDSCNNENINKKQKLDDSNNNNASNINTGDSSKKE